MRRIYLFASAVLVLAALAGCQNNEFSEDMYVPEKGEIVFRLANTATKSSTDATVKGAVMDLGTADGTKLVLEESITYLDQIAYSPETKGTPAYTENFTDLYGNFKAAAFKSNSGTFETTAFDDGVYEKVSGVEIDIWKRKYANLDNSLPLYFFLRAPYANESTTAGVGKVSGLTYYPTAQTVDGKTYAAGSISFSYTSPATATEQEDLLFTSRKLEQSEYEAFQNKNVGIPVLFHHALTGVKFAIANPDGGFNDNKTHTIAITKVVFTGLVNSGSCVITPRQETNGYVDDPTGDYSSGGRNKTTVWTLGTTTGTFSQEFESTDLITYTQGKGNEFSSKGEYPESFAKAGNVNNVNDGDATKTFWFIPQTMNSGVKLTVTFKIDGKEQPEVTLNFGDLTRKQTTNQGTINYGPYATWEAGELRTYTLRIDDVNVKIEDKVTISGAANNGYTGSYKDNVAITNTGNTDAFIRAAIVGQWLNNAGQPVFGFTDRTGSTYETVASWYEDQFVSEEEGVHGEFEGLSGYKGGDNGNNNWYLCEDGYYYYSDPVAPGKIIGTAPQGATNSTDYLGDPLFSKYTIKTAPIVNISGVNTAIHFSLEIATQAISAKKIDGSTYEWQDAWENATGTKPTIKTE